MSYRTWWEEGGGGKEKGREGEERGGMGRKEGGRVHRKVGRSRERKEGGYHYKTSSVLH